VLEEESPDPRTCARNPPSLKAEMAVEQTRQIEEKGPDCRAASTVFAPISSTVPAPEGGELNAADWIFNGNAARSRGSGAKPPASCHGSEPTAVPNFLLSCLYFPLLHWQGYLSTKRSFLRFA
jgi:hypothetical protein